MLTNGWRSQTQQTSKYTSLLSAIVFVHNKSLYTCTCTHTHAHSHNHTRLFHMSILHFWSHHLLQSIYSLYVNISQNTATWIMPGSSQKAFTPEKQACQTLKYSSLFFFSPFITKSLAGDLLSGCWSTLPSPNPLGPMYVKAKHALQGEGESCRRQRGEVTKRSGTACDPLPLLHHHPQNPSRCCRSRWTPPRLPDVAANRVVIGLYNLLCYKACISDLSQNLRDRLAYRCLLVKETSVR